MPRTAGVPAMILSGDMAATDPRLPRGLVSLGVLPSVSKRYSSGANPRRSVFSAIARGSTNCSK
jgi:hypothetical protein